MIIYKITNEINGMSYIGQTKHSLKRRFNQHCRVDSTCTFLKNAIQKYGKSNFSIVVLEESVCPVVMNYKEKLHIKNHNTQRPLGYNLKEGGTGSYSDGFGRNKTKKPSNFKGKTHTPEARAKMSAAKQGHIPWNKGLKKVVG